MLKFNSECTDGFKLKVQKFNSKTAGFKSGSSEIQYENCGKGAES